MNENCTTFVMSSTEDSGSTADQFTEYGQASGHRSLCKVDRSYQGAIDEGQRIT